MGIRRPSKIRLTNFPTFRLEMQQMMPDLTGAQILEIWNFGNDCWTDGYKEEGRASDESIRFNQATIWEANRPHTY